MRERGPKYRYPDRPRQRFRTRPGAAVMSRSVNPRLQRMTRSLEILPQLGRPRQRMAA